MVGFDCHVGFRGVQFWFIVYTLVVVFVLSFLLIECVCVCVNLRALTLLRGGINSANSAEVSWISRCKSSYID